MLNILNTDYLNIAKVYYSSYGLITYALSKPAPLLYLGSISVQRISGHAIVTGYLSPGSDNKPGRANLQVSQDIYDNLLSISTAHGGHALQLSYDELTRAIVGITVT